MKYLIKKGSKIYEQLTALRAEMQAANEASNALAEAFAAEFGEENPAGVNYRRSNVSLAGGISSIQLKEKPKGWKFTARKLDDEYFPKANNKEALEKIQALPKVTPPELNDVLNFGLGMYGGRFFRHPGIYWLDSEILISVPPQAKYTPREGMEEILESAYQEKIRIFEEAQQAAKTT